VISGWVIAAPLLGVFIGLGVTAIALWVGSEMILTLVILAIGIAIGACSSPAECGLSLRMADRT